MKELKDNKVWSAVFQKKLNSELIASCEYLTYVVKESLRIDPPSIYTIPYYSFEEAEVCGVTIPKNTEIMINIGN